MKREKLIDIFVIVLILGAVFFLMREIGIDGIIFMTKFFFSSNIFMAGSLILAAYFIILMSDIEKQNKP